MRSLILATMCFASSACSNIETESGAPQWDFDHNIQFEQTKLSENKYHLQVNPKSDTHFAELATFMMRQSYKICGTYDYTIEVLTGVERIDDRKFAPNLMMHSLSANIECTSQK